MIPDNEEYILSGELLSADASAAIEAGFRAHRRIRIPRLDSDLVLNRPIVMDSGMSLTVDPETVIRMGAGCGGCFLRNRHVYNGCGGSVSPAVRDHDITVEGGIWANSVREACIHDDDPVMRFFGERQLILGVLFFNCADDVTVRNVTIRCGEEYGVLLAGCRDFVISGVFFDDHKKDGIHVNGPAENGLLEDMRGTCGDDFIALNAWDWDSSAISFGAIRRITVRNIHCGHDEMRLLPGRKVYPDGQKTDCPVEDCNYENISGVYNFKLYQQPNCHNAERKANDRSETAGLISRVTFRDIALAAAATDGLAEVHLDGVFEIGADSLDLYFKDISLGDSAADFAKTGMTLVSVGPKSSTWTRGFEDPEKWCELFEPDLICTAKNTAFENIRFAGEACVQGDLLINARRLSLNPDYPHTRPRGGTGYGVIDGLVIR